MAERTNRSAVVIAVLGVLGAALTCLTAYFGLMSSRATTERDEAQASASALSSSVDDLKADLSAQTQLPASATAAPTANAPTPPAETKIRHEGDLDITASSNGADLDAPATDPQWGRFSHALSPELLDLRPSGVGTLVGFTAAVQPTGSADRATCAAETGYQIDQFGTDNLVPGTVWCVHTSADHFGSVKVTAFNGKVLSLHVVVWQD
jgi:hypothetical protein